MMKPKQNIDVAYKRDIEKNGDLDVVPTVTKQTTFGLLFLGLTELICIIALIDNREYIDDIHEKLNSVVLGMLTAGFAQTVIQLYRYANSHRLMKFFIWGGINGLISSLWIDMLVARLPTVTLQVLVDQCIGSPFFQAVFILFNCVWENHDIKPAFRSTFFKMLLTCYMIWPACSIISFNFLEPHHIFPFNCFINVIWTIVLGLMV